MSKSLDALLREVVGSSKNKDVADRIGKSKSYVSQIFAKGPNRQIPTLYMLTVIAKQFDAIDRYDELLLAYAIEHLNGEIEGRRESTIDSADIERITKLVCARLGAAATNKSSIKQHNRTFKDFPHSFYPLAIVTGDKREDRGAHITSADIGAYSATPSDTRWILNLGLDSDIKMVEKHVDKNFLLLSDDELIDQFGEMNLLVIGSPAANHLSRKINKSAVFHFNYSTECESEIQRIIETAKVKEKESIRQLEAYQEEIQRPEVHTILKRNMRALFNGGIFDPTYSHGNYVAASYSQLGTIVEYDFGVLTFAANPYYLMKCQRDNKECDHKYVSIMAAGIHHPATSHALRFLGKDCRDEGFFDEHPYGGVIRVKLDLNKPFPVRTIEAVCEWEDSADGSRNQNKNSKAGLLRELKSIENKITKGELRNLALDNGQVADYTSLIKQL